ncbi:WXG100 family type VII secretion target [Kitasatospora sp. NPDC086801]|uniref:WXG100 family type VII secretion target n=1 Tax=Kitasatospora sp. NPDC086801 TaxID=3364066 RepID=UPI00382CAB31
MAYTDFTSYSHAQLRTMAQALNPGEVMAAGDPWRHAADTLKAIRATLTRASTEAAVTWEGTTSDAFHTRMLHLADSINNAASYANDAANTLHNMSEAIAKAKRDMPEEPSTWEKVKDTVGDGVSSVFGGDDEHIPVADRRKAEAATVMQTLAMHYRIATPALKPPQNLSPLQKSGETRDVTPQDDPTGTAAVASAMMSGTSIGVAGTSGRVTSSPPPRNPKSSEPAMPARSASRSVSVPTDSGIKGGTAQTPPKAQGSVNYGPGVGIAGTLVVLPNGAMATTTVPGTQTSGAGVVPPGGVAGSLPGSNGGQGISNPAGPAAVGLPVGPGTGQAKVGFGGRELPDGANPAGGPGPVGGRATGAGGPYPGGGSGDRGGSGARPMGGPTGRPGGIVGGTARPVEGMRDKEAFTEGGSGLGARNRLRGEPGVGGPGGMAPGMPLTGAQRHKKDREKGGRRPDYLVEDEETWASDKPANPNVVE